MSAPLTGLWVPVITPLRNDGAVDVVALDRLARRLLADGCTGLVVLGTTGEPATLTRQEQQIVTETCASACRDATRGLIVGVGSNSTAATIESVLELDASIAPSALLVVVPYYTRPSPAGIVDHFRAIADSVETPIVVYNVPYRTGRAIDVDSLLELAMVPHIVGVKQAVGALDNDTLELLRRKPSTFAVLAGDDAFIVPTMLMGGEGAIAAAAHVCTGQFVAMTTAALNGDAAVARAVASALLPVVNAGFAEPNPAVWKGALRALGEIECDALRAPMTAASAAAVGHLVSAVRTAEQVRLQLETLGTVLDRA